MAFLPPDLAFQVTISVYLIVGSMGVCSFLSTSLHSPYQSCLGDYLGYLEQLAQRLPHAF